MRSISEFVEESAKELVIDLADRGLDFSQQSLEIIERLLNEAAGESAGFEPEFKQRLVQMFGCYILEVGRRMFGGHYVHHPDENAPVLIVGDKDRHVALLTWAKVAGRLGGDEGDNIPFFFKGFAQAVAGPQPDHGVLYT